MKPLREASKAGLVCAFAMLAACEVTVDQDAAAYAENQAAELANQAEGLAEQARDEVGAAAGIVERQAGALQNELNEREAPAENELANAQ